MSQDGNKIAIGAIRHDVSSIDEGQVKVFEWNGVSWNQLGANIDGVANSDMNGYSVSMSNDGNTLAMGAIYNDAAGISAGHVRIFEWNNSSWTQKGASINGESPSDLSGICVSMSGNGNTLGIGAHNNDGNGSNSGHVRIYEWSNNAWIQKGNDIDGEATDDNSGWNISISDDGNTIAIGAQLNDGIGTSAGHVRIFSWDGNTWVQMGSDIDGEASGDLSGWTVSMSADGNTVAIGANANDGNGSLAGHVRVYNFTCNTAVANTGTDTVSACDSYTWIDGITYNSNNNTATYTLTNVSGCDSIVTLNLTINSSPIVDLGPDTTYCSGSTYTLDAGSGYSSYLWNDSSTNATLNVTGTGIYYVNVQDSNNCYGFDTVNITLGTLNVDAGPSDTVCLGAADIPSDSIALTGSGAQTYSWDNGVIDGVYFTPQQTTMYTVIGTDSNGCTGTDSVLIYVGSISFGSVSQTAMDSIVINGQTFTQSGTYTQTLTNIKGCDSIITLELTINHVGLIQNNLSGISIYPNPSWGIIKIDGLQKLDGFEYMRLTDNKGSLIKLIATKQEEIDLSYLSTGIYFLEIRHANGSGRIKLIKQ